ALGGHTGALEGLCVGADADRQDDEVGLQTGAVGEDDDVVLSAGDDLLGAGPGVDGDPEPAQLLGGQPRELRLERRQDVRCELDERGVQALRGERLGGLDADEAGSEDDGAAGAPVDLPAQGDGVVDGAQGAHARGVEAGQRGTDGTGAGGQDERVVADALLAAGGAHEDLARLGVEPDDLVAGTHVEVESRAQPLGCLDEEVVGLGDLAAHVVGQTAVGEGDVLPALEDDDLRALVEPARAGGAAHAAGDAAHDDDPGGGGSGHVTTIYPQGYPVVVGGA